MSILHFLIQYYYFGYIFWKFICYFQPNKLIIGISFCHRTISCYPEKKCYNIDFVLALQEGQYYVYKNKYGNSKTFFYV